MGERNTIHWVINGGVVENVVALRIQRSERRRFLAVWAGYVYGGWDSGHRSTGTASEETVSTAILKGQP